MNTEQILQTALIRLERLTRSGLITRKVHFEIQDLRRITRECERMIMDKTRKDNNLRNLLSYHADIHRNGLSMFAN